MHGFIYGPSVPLIYISVFVPISYCFNDCSFVVQCEVRESNSSRSIFLRIALAIQGLLCFHKNFNGFCSSSVKNVIGNFIGIALNL